MDFESANIATSGVITGNESTKMMTSKRSTKIVSPRRFRFVTGSCSRTETVADIETKNRTNIQPKTGPGSGGVSGTGGTMTSATKVKFIMGRLKQAAKTKNAKLADSLLEEIMENDQVDGLIACNAAVNVYAKCGSWEKVSRFCGTGRQARFAMHNICAVDTSKRSYTQWGRTCIADLPQEDDLKRRLFP